MARAKWMGGMAQVVEQLLGKCETLSPTLKKSRKDILTIYFFGIPSMSLS
jgi:hypothetical protein